MSEYALKLDPSTVAAAEHEIAEREHAAKRQQYHYFYLNELQKMARELPGKYQQRLPYDLLSLIANSVLDGTVFQITKSLIEVQQMEEKSLFNQRVRLINEHKAQRQEMQKKQKDAVLDCQARPHHLAIVQSQNERELEVMEKRFEEEIKKKDMRIILELDQKVMEQQSTLEKAGVPGFYVTNAPNEVRVQMYLLEFISKLADMQKQPP